MAMTEFTCGIPNELWNGMEREERQEGRRRWNALSKDDHRAIWDGKRPPLAEMVGEAEWDWSDPAAAEAEKTIQDQVRAGRMKLRTLPDGRRRLEFGPELAFRERINREVVAAMRAKNLPTAEPCAAEQPLPSDPREFEKVCKARWNADPSLRAEFADQFGWYLSLTRAEAEQQQRKARKRAAAASPPAPSDEALGIDPALPLEDRCRARWRQDPALRAEYDKWGGFDAYLAFERYVEKKREQRGRR